MTVEQKAEEYKKKNIYFQAIKRKDGTCGAEEVSKVSIPQAFIDGYKECEKEHKDCQDFIWESVGFKKRGFVNSIQIADYIDKLEKEREETRKKVIEIFANDEAQQGELWKACGLRLVGWDYEKNQLDENFMLLYGVSN